MEVARIHDDMVVPFVSGWVDTVEGMRNVMWGAAVALLVGAAGCTSGTPAHLPSEDESPEAAIPVVATTAEPVEVGQSTPSPEPSVSRASAETIAPDEAIMATMECEPLSEETADQLEQVFAPPYMDPVQVLVGEGLTPGEKWWVVVTDVDWDRSEGWNQWLTNQPGVSGRGKWIGIGGSMRLPDGSMGSSFDNIHWDHERLVRARAALTKAFECLGGAIPPSSVASEG